MQLPTCTGAVRYASAAVHKAHCTPSCSPIAAPFLVDKVLHCRPSVANSRRENLELLLYVLPKKALAAPSRCDLKEDLSSIAVLPQLLSRSAYESRAPHAHTVYLKHGQELDYTLHSRLFWERMRKEGWTYDGPYDWGTRQGSSRARFSRRITTCCLRGSSRRQVVTPTACRNRSTSTRRA
ncbi:hypothetical protein C8Q77DRAFT_200324 [Trametes polyzona]|nr:hypothetical protein C8Q77DRAFT_200324 [Trametes polyzona]